MYFMDLEDGEDDEDKDENWTEKATGPDLQSTSKPLKNQNSYFANDVRNSKMHFLESSSEVIHAENRSRATFVEGSKNAEEQQSAPSLMYNNRTSVKSEGVWKDRETKESTENLKENGEGSRVNNSDKPVVSFQSTSGEYSVSKSSTGELLLLVNGQLFRHVSEEDIEDTYSHKTVRTSQTPDVREKTSYREKTKVHSLSQISNSSKRDLSRLLMADFGSAERGRHTTEPVDQIETTQTVQFEDWSHDVGQIKVTKTSKSLSGVEHIAKRSEEDQRLKCSSEHPQPHNNSKKLTSGKSPNHQLNQLDKCRRSKDEEYARIKEKQSPQSKIELSRTTSSICECMERYKNECDEDSQKATALKSSNHRIGQSEKGRSSKEKDEEHRKAKNKENDSPESKIRLSRTTSSIRECMERYKNECDEDSQKSTALKSSNRPMDQVDKCCSKETDEEHRKTKNKDKDSSESKIRLSKTSSSICECMERYTCKDECERIDGGSKTSQKSDACNDESVCNDGLKRWLLHVHPDGSEQQKISNVDNNYYRMNRSDCGCRPTEPDETGKVDMSRKKGSDCGCKSKAQRNIFSNFIPRRKRSECEYYEGKNYTGISRKTCDRFGLFGTIPRSHALSGKTCNHSGSIGSSCCSKTLQPTYSVDLSHAQPFHDFPDRAIAAEGQPINDPMLQTLKASDADRKQRRRKDPTANSQPNLSDFEETLIRKADGSTIIRSLLIDGSNRPNLPMIGEIAGQLESRIVQYVFAGLDRKSSYGLLVRNIPEVIEISCFDRETRRINVPLHFRLVKRFAYIKTSLRPFGYDFDFHPQFSIDMVNKYGRLDLSGTATKFQLSPIDLDVRQDLSSFIQATCSPTEAEHVTILLDCLLLLASDDGKTLFIWQQK